MSKKKVVVYSQPECSACKSAKAYLSEKGIAFEEKNVREDDTAFKELTEKYKSNSTPTILVGDELIRGFDREKLEELLA